MLLGEIEVWKSHNFKTFFS